MQTKSVVRWYALDLQPMKCDWALSTLLSKILSYSRLEILPVSLPASSKDDQIEVTNEIGRQIRSGHVVLSIYLWVTWT